jgi:subtilisin family serine protease
MSRRLSLCLIFLVALSAPVVARESDKWTTCEYLPGKLIVDFTPDVKLPDKIHLNGESVTTGVASLDAIFKTYEVHSARRLVPDGILSRLKAAPDFYHTYVLDFRDGFPVLDVLDALAVDSHVRLVVPDLLRRIFRVPNDPHWTDQWDKRKVRAPAVWDISTGSRSIICSSIDTGIDWNHPDLVPNLWVNPVEDLNQDSVALTSQDYPGDEFDIDGVDNDENGYIDDLLGWDFIQSIDGCAPGEDCDNETDNDMSGLNPHGTHTAGIMVARGNNSIGVCGMNWVGRLMAVRAGYDDVHHNGYMPEDATIAATEYATAMGANILNMSYGGTGNDPLAQASINAAWDQGCMIFAASGNEGTTTVQYPANYDNVISVNATDDRDHLAWWSNRGTWTDLCAPGGDPGIMSTVINGYESFEGTSMASPNAAGVAALVWSVFPYMTNADVRDLLQDNAVNIDGQNPNLTGQLGNGRVDAQAAVASLYPDLSISGMTLNDSVGGDGDGRLERGETASLILQISNGTDWARGDQISLVISSNDPRLIVSNDSLFLGDIDNGLTVSTQANPVTLAAAANLDTVYDAVLNATFSSPGGFSETKTLTFRLGRGKVLIVDDDGTADYQTYYANAVAGTGTTFDLWNVATAGIISTSELESYAAVIWSCGDQSTNTLTSQDRIHLGEYLDSGRNLILVGQNIDEDIHGTTFYSDYLHVQTGAATGSRQLRGMVGDPVSEGMSLLLQGGDCAANGLLSPSQIVPLEGATTTFEYTAGGAGAIQYEGNYKVVYFAFALEAACGMAGTTRYDDVISNMLGWMGALDVPQLRSLSGLPTTIALHGNYPNPFNPTTTISFDLNAAAKVKLQVFDLLGRQVTTLVDAYMPAGSHRAVFDGSAFASGVYVVRLQAGGVNLSSKMALIK